VLSVAEVEKKLAIRMNTGIVIRVYVNLMTFRDNTTEAVILFCYLWFWFVKLSCILCVNSPIQEIHKYKHRDADKSLAQPSSRCILFDGENISLDASPVIFINSTNVPVIMIINRI
jgi:hypothetical protein